VVLERACCQKSDPPELGGVLRAGSDRRDDDEGSKARHERPPFHLLLNHLIRPQQQRRRDGEIECFSRRGVYQKLELPWLLDW
jgi:hypothetical protein